MNKELDDVFVHLIDLPIGTNEVVSPNTDGTYSIFINAKLSNDGQLRAYKHAINHINQNDFSKADVQTIEYRAHYKDNKGVPAPKYIAELKRLQQRIREDAERVQFIQQFCDVFAMNECKKLYGDNL